MKSKLTLLALMALVLTAFTGTASAHEHCYRHYYHCGSYHRGCYVSHYCAPVVEETVIEPVQTVWVGGCRHWHYSRYHYCGHYHYHHCR